MLRQIRCLKASNVKIVRKQEYCRRITVRWYSNTNTIEQARNHISLSKTKDENLNLIKEAEVEKSSWILDDEKNGRDYIVELQSMLSDAQKDITQQLNGKSETPSDVNDKIKTKERILLNNLSSILKSNDNYFNETMKHLGTILTDIEEESSKGILNDYKKLYNQSIPQFMDLMIQHPSSVFDITPDKRIIEEFLSPPNVNSSEKVEQIYNQLHAIGFHNVKRVKNYNNWVQYTKSMTRLEREIEKKKKDVFEYARVMDVLRGNLNNLKTKLEEYDATYIPRHLSHENVTIETNKTVPVSQTHTEENGFFSKIVNFFSSESTSTLSSTEINIETDKVEETQKELRQQAYNLKTQLKEMRMLHNTTQESYDELVSSYSQLSFQNNTNEQHIQSVLDDIILKDICPALAYYISDWHYEVLERYKQLDKQTDLSRPQDWYMYARMQKRNIIFHGGPTNSGKTYEALQKLKQAKKGLYLAPLRLLASEIAESLNTQGIPCNLLTGQEKREVENAMHTAATVEMAQTEQEYDVVVVDEIQMIGDNYRGYAWTRALLGIRCKEMHLCGGMETFELIKTIAESCNDEVQLQSYERFAPLLVEQRALAKYNEVGTYSKVQPGDCIVAFSQKDLYAIKQEIEASTDYKCSIVYGSLPPETRTQQAKLFNNHTNDILVASDAIGMGLNLNIRRVIFHTLFKFNENRITRLNPSLVKQISGRAGRRNSPFPQGYVTCRNAEDMPYLRQCLNTSNATIHKAGLFPTIKHIKHFSHLKNNPKLYDILSDFQKMATLQENYFFCNQEDMLQIANLIDQIPLTIQDKFKFSLCPINLRDSNGQPKLALKKFAWKHYIGQTTKLTRTDLPDTPASSLNDLMNLCSLYSEIDIFLWLCIRFPDSTLGANTNEMEKAKQRKKKLIEMINEGIENSNEDWELDHCYVQKDVGLRHRFRREEDERNGVRREDRGFDRRGNNRRDGGRHQKSYRSNSSGHRHRSHSSSHRS